jgi:hypothetical protein
MPVMMLASAMGRKLQRAIDERHGCVSRVAYQSPACAIYDTSSQ